MSVKIFVSCCSTPESMGSSLQVSLFLSGSLSGTPRTSILIIFWRTFDARFAFHTTPRAAATPRRLWPRATAAATVAACRLWRFFRQVGFPSSAVRAVKPLLYPLSFSLSLSLSLLFVSQSSINICAKQSNNWQQFAMSLKSQPRKQSRKNEGKKEKLVHFHCRFLQKSQRERETKMPPQSLIVPIAQ